MSASNSAGSPEGGRRFTWDEFYRWWPNADEYISKPHDRPAPPLRSPCISWGFSVRPERLLDPISARVESEEKRLREQWVDQLNDALSVFEDDRFEFPFDDMSSELVLDGGSAKAQRLRQEAGRKENPIPVHALYFPIIWRHVPGVVQVERHTEFASFLFAFSAELHRPAWLKRRELASGPQAVDWGRGDVYQRLCAGLDTLGRSDRGFENESAQRREVEQAAGFVFDGFWRLFAQDMVEVLRLRREAEKRPTRGDAPGPRLFPGEVFASLRMATLRADDNGPGCAQRAQSQREIVDPKQLEIEDPHQFLEERKKVLDYMFPDAPEREFVGNLALDGRCAFVSTLGSTILHQKARGYGRGEYGETAPTPPSRAVVLLKRSADSHQVGRMVERLHALQVYRIAALFDFSRLVEVGSELRRLGFQLDTFISGSPERSPSRTKEELNDLLKNLQNLGNEIRGGLSYRVSRAVLYAKTFAKRIEEMNIKVVPTWQPYDEFIKRRLQRSFDYIEDIGERRNRLLHRIELFIERLQWNELNEVQQEAKRTLQSTDVIAYVGVIVGAAAVGVEAADGAREVFAGWLDHVPAVFAHPLALQPAPAATSGASAAELEAIDALRSANARAEAANASVFGAFVGAVLGVVGSFVLAGWRIAERTLRRLFQQVYADLANGFIILSVVVGAVFNEVVQLRILPLWPALNDWILPRPPGSEPILIGAVAGLILSVAAVCAATLLARIAVYFRRGV